MFGSSLVPLCAALMFALLVPAPARGQGAAAVAQAPSAAMPPAPPPVTVTLIPDDPPEPAAAIRRYVRLSGFLVTSASPGDLLVRGQRNLPVVVPVSRVGRAPPITIPASSDLRLYRKDDFEAARAAGQTPVPLAVIQFPAEGSEFLLILAMAPPPGGGDSVLYAAAVTDPFERLGMGRFRVLNLAGVRVATRLATTDTVIEPGLSTRFDPGNLERPVSIPVQLAADRGGRWRLEYAGELTLRRGDRAVLVLLPPQATGTGALTTRLLRESPRLPLPAPQPAPLPPAGS